MGNKKLDSLFGSKYKTITFNGAKIRVKKLSFREAQELDQMSNELREATEKGGDASARAQLEYTHRILSTLIDEFKDVGPDTLEDYPLADVMDLMSKAIEAATGNKAPLTDG